MCTLGRCIRLKSFGGAPEAFADSTDAEGGLGVHEVDSEGACVGPACF